MSTITRVVSRVILAVIASPTLSTVSVVVAGAAERPYPATLTMTRGLSQSSAAKALPWGTRLTAVQARGVRYESTGPTFRWGVWYWGPSETFPVRSVDGGAHWTAAGPMFATDWAGGSLYYVKKVFAESPAAVVMVSNSIIDVTTNGGHQWYQYLNAADNWVVAAHTVTAGGIAIRVSPTSYAQLPKGSYAIYVFDVPRHQWRRVQQSLR